MGSARGIAKISVKETVSLWVGKQGYYPYHHYTQTVGDFYSIKGQYFTAKIYLHKVKDGSFEETKNFFSVNKKY